MSASVTFIAPPPGLSPIVDFALDAVDGAAGLFTLRSDERGGIRLFLVDAARYVPDYVPSFSEADYASIGATGSEDAEVYVVTTVDEGSPVVNLLAPVLVNAKTGSAAQLILSEDWPLRAPLAVS